MIKSSYLCPSTEAETPEAVKPSAAWICLHPGVHPSQGGNSKLSPPESGRHSPVCSQQNLTAPSCLYTAAWLLPVLHLCGRASAAVPEHCRWDGEVWEHSLPRGDASALLPSSWGQPHWAQQGSAGSAGTTWIWCLVLRFPGQLFLFLITSVFPPPLPKSVREVTAVWWAERSQSIQTSNVGEMTETLIS